MLWKDPGLAAEAFHWAGRLDPMSTTALYGERVAILAQIEGHILDYYLHTVPSRERARVRAADSLMERVVRLDPLLHRPLEDELVARAVMALATRNIQVQGGEPNQGSWYEVRALLVREGKEEQRSSTWIGPWNRRDDMRALAPGHYKLVCTRQGGAGGPEPSVQELDLKEGETVEARFQAR